MATYTVDLPCIEDTYIDQDYPNTNYGSSTTLKTRSLNLSRAVMLFRFDYSAIPTGKRITKALFRFYVTNSVTMKYIARITTVSGHSASWSEYTSTWKTVGEHQYWSTGWIATPGDSIWYGAGSYKEIELEANRVADNGTRSDGIFIYASNLEGSTDYLIIQSREGANPPMLRVTYEDIPPNAPTPTEPIGLYKDSKSIIRFAWKYNSSVGGEQKKFDLQWSIDQSTWTTVSETTANNYYDMPAETFPAGNIYWRVRTYNEYDEVGPYCDIQSFYAIGAPNAPAINAIPTDTARPTVSWSAFSQQVYQLQVLSDDTIVYDSSVVPGINIRSHKINTWLADGSYAVKMRIKNEYDLWSEWSTTTVTISTAKPDKPSLTLQRSVYGVDINATGLIYRSDYNKDDYICIGTATGTFYDNAVVSGREYKYFVRAVSENDTYNDSDIKFIQAEFRHALIAPVTDLTNVFAFTRSLNAPPKRTYNRQSGGAMVQYAGRTHPVWEPDEHISAGLSLSFFLRAWAEVETFMTIYDLNSTVLYRDAKGRKIYGTLSNLSVNDDILGYIIGFTISQVDYNEEV